MYVWVLLGRERVLEAFIYIMTWKKVLDFESCVLVFHRCCSVMFLKARLGIWHMYLLILFKRSLRWVTNRIFPPKGRPVKNKHFDGKSTATKAKTNKRDYSKLRSFCLAKETINKMKRQSTEWEKISASHITEKGSIFKIYKE